ncbi:hypothetical protein BH11ARM1_BH11ARM1_13070 [soil metagenome]
MQGGPVHNISRPVQLLTCAVLTVAFVSVLSPSFLQSTVGTAITLLFLAVVGGFQIRAVALNERDLKSAQAIVSGQEATNRQIASNLPIGFFKFLGGSITESNDAWDRLIGRTPQQNRWDAFVSRLHEDDRDRVIDQFKRSEEAVEPFGLAYRLCNADGSVRHVETRAAPVLDQNDELTHMAAFLMDISSRVRAQRLLEDKNREVQETNDMLRSALSEIEDNFEAMVQSLVKAVDAKDQYTAGHSERVMAYSLKIGQRLGLSPSEMRVLKMGTLVHDIGKIGVPDAILTKPDKLTTEEYELVMQHPMLGYKMIESIPTFSECLPIVLHHHEKLDGTGYPFGLKGLEIPLLVRICTVSDSFDAMTSDRAYRKGLDPLVAINELLTASDGNVVDRNLVEVLADVIKEEGLTTVVDMSVA